MTKTFAQLPVGAEFEFASATDTRFLYSGMERGPWIKTGFRTYTKVQFPDFRCKVGSRNAVVIPVEVK